MSKTNGFVIACLLSLSLAFLLNRPSIEEKVNQSHINELLSQTVTSSYIENHITQALESHDVALAGDYLYLSESLQVPVSESLKYKVSEQASDVNQAYYQALDFFSGAITGEGSSMASLTGSMVADFTVIGDVRDLAVETKHYVAGEPVDELVAGLSVVGLALSAGTVLSWGTTSVFTTPVKMSVSLMKYAAKTSRLTKGFRNYLSGLISKAVNFDPIYKKMSDLQTTGKWTLKEFKTLEKIAKNNVHLTKLETVGERLAMVQNAAGSSRNTLYLLGYVESGKDLKIIANFAKLYGKRSAVVLKVLGKKAFRVTKYSVKHFVKLLGLFLMGIYSLVALWFSRIIYTRLFHSFRKYVIHK